MFKLKSPVLGLFVGALALLGTASQAEAYSWNSWYNIGPSMPYGEDKGNFSDGAATVFSQKVGTFTTMMLSAFNLFQNGLSQTMCESGSYGGQPRVDDAATRQALSSAAAVTWTGTGGVNGIKNVAITFIGSDTGNGVPNKIFVGTALNQFSITYDGMGVPHSNFTWTSYSIAAGTLATNSRPALAIAKDENGALNMYLFFKKSDNTVWYKRAKNFGTSGAVTFAAEGVVPGSGVVSGGLAAAAVTTRIITLAASGTTGSTCFFQNATVTAATSTWDAAWTAMSSSICGINNGSTFALTPKGPNGFGDQGALIVASGGYFYFWGTLSARVTASTNPGFVSVPNCTNGSTPSTVSSIAYSAQWSSTDYTMVANCPIGTNVEDPLQNALTL